MSQAYERIIEALEAHGSDSKDVRQGHSVWQCPAHDDNGPSLAVDDKGDKALVYCHARCHTDDVLAAIGLDVTSLFDGELTASTSRHTAPQLVRSYLYEKGNGDPYFYVDRYYPKTFRQRLPGVEPVRDLADRDAARHLGISHSVKKPIVYHYPRLLRHMNAEPTEVWWLDGEKDVETAERHGLVATCPPGFAKWEPDYATAIKGSGATGVVMVVDQDKEKPDGTLGAGQQTAIAARMGFRSVGLKVRVVSPAVGKDLSDHFAAGYGPEAMIPDPSLVTRPRGVRADALMTHEFSPITWAVPHLLPTGLTILAGSPKAGKSWVCLDVGCAVAAGGRALGVVPVDKGSVLYLAREDTYRRLQDRIKYLMGGTDSAPPDLELVPGDVEWIGGEEGLSNMTEWAEAEANPRLVVIDTIAKVEPEMGEDRNRGAYSGNYTMMARYKHWADTHNIAVLMVHHDNKTKPDKDNEGWMSDPFTQISGTRGLTGAADTLLFLETKRFSTEGRLHITGRDVEEQSVEMRKMGALWALYGVLSGEE